MFDIRKPALTFSAVGLMYRTCALAKRESDTLQANAAALAMLARPAQVAVVEKAINAWNRGEQTRALIYLAHLGEPELKTETQVRAELAKAGYDQNELRDDHNQEWVAGNGPNSNGVASDSTTPSDAVSYTAGDGTQFYAPPSANFKSVYDYGSDLAQNPTPAEPIALWLADGHYGLFDYQRFDGHFHPDYINASNYGVGVLLNGAGYSLDETTQVAGTFAHLMSSDAKSPNQAIWWKKGWEDADGGKWK